MPVVVIPQRGMDEAYLCTNTKAPSFLFAIDKDCFLYTAAAGVVQREVIPELECGDKEADTRLIFHANFIAENHEGQAPQLVVQSIDSYHFFITPSILMLSCGSMLVSILRTRRRKD